MHFWIAISPISRLQRRLPSSAAQDVDEIAHRYISSRRAQTTVLKAITLLGESKIEKNTDGTISAEEFKDLNGKPKKFAEIGPMLFREVDGQDKLAFKRDYQGNWEGVIDYPVRSLPNSAVV